MTTQLRESFQKEHPAPVDKIYLDEVYYDDSTNRYRPHIAAIAQECRDYNKLWEGYQSGAEDRQAEVRMFPILKGSAIPWDLIAPHEHQAQANHYQTLERLAARGGLGASEAMAVLEDRPWKSMGNTEAAEQLATKVKAYKGWFTPADGERMQQEIDELKCKLEEIAQAIC